MRPLATILIALLCGTGAAAQDLRRATVWDLKLGQGIAAQPSRDEFRGFACGSNGGPPRARLSGWSDFARCPAEPDGLREVYFEYDDEYEYIARAKDLEREVTRWAGTTEMGFPVIVSALFDAGDVLKGIRIVTDSRPDYRNDTTDADLRKREDAYLFGGRMASRFNIDAKRDCTALPPVEGESAVGNLFVKQSCTLVDAEHRRKIELKVSFYRKPGQSAFNPQMSTQLTQGQFESSAKLEVFDTGGQ
ncbi:MAG TPA: hypothetical protein VIY51_06755 [Xanthobacteraceae bacterium]